MHEQLSTLLGGKGFQVHTDEQRSIPPESRCESPYLSVFRLHLDPIVRGETNYPFRSVDGDVNWAEPSLVYL